MYQLTAEYAPGNQSRLRPGAISAELVWTSQNASSDSDFIWKMDTLQLGFMLKNSHPSLKFRRINRHSESAAKP